MEHKDVAPTQEIFDLRGPQKSFISGKLPLFAEQSHSRPEVCQINFQRLFENKNKPNLSVALWNRAQDAFDAVLDQLALSLGRAPRVGTSTPTPIRFDFLNCEVIELSNQAIDWDISQMKALDILLIQNPSHWDGHYLPNPFFQKNLDRLFEQCPHLFLFIDQRFALYQWEDLCAVDARKCHIQNPYMILDSTFPTLNPLPSLEVAWSASENFTKFEPTLAPELNQKLEKALYLVAAQRTQQGVTAVQVQKNTLVIKESLKRISSAIQLKQNAMHFKINHWPSCGWHLKLDFDSELWAQKALQTFKTNGIDLIKGSNHKAPKSLMLCYAMHLSQCDRLIKRIHQI